MKKLLIHGRNSKHSGGKYRVGYVHGLQYVPLTDTTYLLVPTNTSLYYMGDPLELYITGDDVNNNFYAVVTAKSGRTFNSVIIGQHYVFSNEVDGDFYCTLVDSMTIRDGSYLNIDVYNNLDVKIGSVVYDSPGYPTPVKYMGNYQSAYQDSAIIPIYDAVPNSAGGGDYELPAWPMLVSDPLSFKIGGDAIDSVDIGKIEVWLETSTIDGSKDITIPASQLTITRGYSFNNYGAYRNVPTIDIETNSSVQGTGSGEIDIKVYDSNNKLIARACSTLTVTN